MLANGTSEQAIALKHKSWFLANFAKHPTIPSMTTMNISLPDSLKSFVDEQVAGRGYGTSSEYVRELIRRDQDRQHLRGLLLEGASSPAGAPADRTYFEGLRGRAHSHKAG
jgi:antitoxin ParD1/3/4